METDVSRLRVTAISDTHTHHNEVELKGGDILIHAGDISYFGQPEEVESFLRWFGEQDYTHKIFIAGNHDLGFEPINIGKESDAEGNFTFRGMLFQKGLATRYCDLCNEYGITYLQDRAVEIEGYKIYGSAWTPEFCGWAFNYELDWQRPFYRSECLNVPKADEIWSQIPDDTDILVTHGPPRDVMDRNPNNYGDNRLGCEFLLKHVLRAKPMYHIFGHIHEGHGRKEKHGIKFINAAFCGIPYEKFNRPINFYLKRTEDSESS